MHIYIISPSLFFCFHLLLGHPLATFLGCWPVVGLPDFALSHQASKNLDKPMWKKADVKKPMAFLKGTWMNMIYKCWVDSTNVNLQEGNYSSSSDIFNFCLFMASKHHFQGFSSTFSICCTKAIVLYSHYTHVKSIKSLHVPKFIFSRHKWKHLISTITTHI